MSDGILLVSDLDGTLVGDEPALEKFAAWHEANRDRVTLVYATGRLFDDVRQLVSRTLLPEPYAVISAVGSDIRTFADSRPVAGWPLASQTTWDATRVRATLADEPELKDQPADVQTPYKVSYFAYDLTSADLQRLTRRLADAGIVAGIIYSSRRDLDVMPAGVNKGSAVAHLVKHLRRTPEEVIVCGDTGNDVAMFQAGFRGIVVGNAHRELKSLACERVFVARSYCAGGVLEGVEYWAGRGASRC